MKVESQKLNKLWIWVLWGALILSLAACSQGTDLPETGQEQEGVTATFVQEQMLNEAGYTMEELRSDLEAEGGEVITGEQVSSTLFPVDGRVMVVDGSAVEVFQFENQAARELVTNTITRSEELPGVSEPRWQGAVTFWGYGRLAVVYPGEDGTVRGLLTQALGDPIATIDLSQEALGTQIPLDQAPQAVSLAMRNFAVDLGVDVPQVSLVAFEQREWNDSCLGLGQANESCALVVTPGWLVKAQVNGTTYEIHTDESGANVRWVEAPAAATPSPGEAETPQAQALQVFVVAIGDQGQNGRLIGCGDSLVQQPMDAALPADMPVEEQIRLALETLLSLENNGQEDRYTALANSDLQVDEVTLQDGAATVQLSGQVSLGGTCDTPRFEEQLRETVLQFSAVQDVQITLNGEPLEQALSAQG